MSTPESYNRGSVQVDRRMLHDLVNHLSIALGHSDLLLMDLDATARSHASLIEIRDSCRRAIDMVEGWRANLPPEA